MEKTIKEIIIEEVLKENIYPEEYIIKKIDQLGKQPLKKSKILNKNLNIKLIEKNIQLTEEFFNLTIEEANSIFRISITLTKNYVKSLSYKLINIFKNLKEKQISRKKGTITHPKLEKLIETIKKSPILSQCLKEDMIYREKINTLDEIEMITTQKFINTKLDLTDEELAFLRRYLLNEITLEDIDTSKNKYKYYNQITKIYEELTYYIKKLKYKEILKQNYKNLEELGLSESEINILKRNYITSIEDLIDFSEKELLKVPKLGKQMLIKILTLLEEKKIILLADKAALKDALKQENANIIPNEIIKNQK